MRNNQDIPNVGDMGGKLYLSPVTAIVWTAIVTVILSLGGSAVPS